MSYNNGLYNILLKGFAVFLLSGAVILSLQLFYTGNNINLHFHGNSFKRALIQNTWKENSVRSYSKINDHEFINGRHAGFSGSSCKMSKYIETLGLKCETQNESIAYRECDIKYMNNDCDKWRKSYLYGKDGTTFEQKKFSLAYALKIHTSPNQAHRLLRFIYEKHNVYCIHVDKKAKSYIHAYFRIIDKCFENIFVIKDPVSVAYASILQVQAELKCMKVLNDLQVDWKYYINLSGQEFMLKTNLEIVKILKILNNTNNIISNRVPANQRKKISWRHIIKNGTLVRTPVRKANFSYDVEIRKGSAYGMCTRAFVKYVLKDDFVQDLLLWLNDTLSPEEFFWATLQNLNNTPGGCAGKMCPRFISRVVIWSNDFQRRRGCNGKFIRDVCIFGLKDIPMLLRHKYIAANKFYETYQPLALDCLEQKMYYRMLYDRPSSIDINEYKSFILANSRVQMNVKYK